MNAAVLFQRQRKKTAAIATTLKKNLAKILPEEKYQITQNELVTCALQTL